MGWIWPGDSFSPFAIQKWSKGLSATHGARQMAPTRMLRDTGCRCILQVRGPVTGSDTHLWRDETTIFLGKSHPMFNVHMMSNIFLPPGVYLSPPKESWHKHLPLLQICGVPGDQPCVTAACGGALCRDSQGVRQCGGPNCSGAFPLSTDAFRKAEETAVLLNNLTTLLREPETQVLYIKPTSVQWNGWRMKFGRSQIYKNSPAPWTKSSDIAMDPVPTSQTYHGSVPGVLGASPTKRLWL